MPSFIGFIPTPPAAVAGFFELAPVAPTDVVYDLGAGDGRLLFAALERGAGRAVGFELDGSLIPPARALARQKGLAGRLRFRQGDFMQANLGQATLVLGYLYPTACTALKPKLEAELKAGTRVVMESFAIHGWRPVRILKRGERVFFLYVMPPAASPGGGFDETGRTQGLLPALRAPGQGAATGGERRAPAGLPPLQPRHLAARRAGLALRREGVNWPQSGSLPYFPLPLLGRVRQPLDYRFYRATL